MRLETNMRSLKELIQVANHLYNADASREEWLQKLQPVELAKLWNETCQITKSNPFGASYDDEIYNALSTLNYFD